jgi:hypothetical protein
VGLAWLRPLPRTEGSVSRVGPSRTHYYSVRCYWWRRVGWVGRVVVVVRTEIG